MHTGSFPIQRMVVAMTVIIYTILSVKNSSKIKQTKKHTHPHPKKPQPNKKKPNQISLKGDLNDTLRRNLLAEIAY